MKPAPRPVPSRAAPDHWRTTAAALAALLAGSAYAQGASGPDDPPVAAAGQLALQAPMVGVAAPSPAATPVGPPVPLPVPTLVSARVLSVTSVAQVAPATRLVCAEPAEVPAPTTGAGAMVGAIVGAAVGSQVGGGSGQSLAAAAGLVGGALVGDRAEHGGRTQTVRPCVIHSGPGPALSFQVVYEWAGQHYSTILPYHPGASVSLQLTQVITVPTDVSPGAVASSAPPVAPAVVSHTVVMAVPPSLAYAAHGYYYPYWRAPVVIGVGSTWGRPYRGWYGYRRW